MADLYARIGGRGRSPIMPGGGATLERAITDERLRLRETGPQAVGVGADIYDYYVSLAGSDSWNGTTPAFVSGSTGPFATIQHALSIASSSLTGTGKVIAVLAGTYDQLISNPTALGTSWTNKIRVVNYQGGVVRLRPNAGNYVMYLPGSAGQAYLEFDGINFDGSSVTYGIIKIEGNVGANAHHIRVQNAELYAAKANPVTEHWTHVSCQASFSAHLGGAEFINLDCHGLVQNLDGLPNEVMYFDFKDCLLDGCEIHDVCGNAWQVYSVQGLPLPGIVIRNNYIHDLNTPSQSDSSHRIVVGNIYNGVGTQVYNNIHANIGGGGATQVVGGVRLRDPASDCRIWFNTFVSSTGQGFDIQGGTGTLVQNNVSWDHDGSNYYDPNGLATENHNDLGGGADPGFVNAAGGNYHLAAGSRLRSQGIDVSAVQTDSDGISRLPAPPDIGAYEYV